jgi:hypothetical protein
MEARMSDYLSVVVESFWDTQRNRMAIRPVAGEAYPQDMVVESGENMRKDFPEGTKFRIQAKLKSPKDRTCRAHLYTSYKWKYEVLEDN